MTVYLYVPFSKHILAHYSAVMNGLLCLARATHRKREKMKELWKGICYCPHAVFGLYVKYETVSKPDKVEWF